MTHQSIRAVIDELIRQANHFDLDRNRLGESLMDAAVEQFLAEMGAETDPDGNRWPELSEAYAAAKEEIAPGAPMAVLYHEMLTLANLRGERELGPAKATMTFGTDDDAKQKAEWFIEGAEDNNQPPRPFYEFSAACEGRFDAILDAHFDRIF